MLTAIFVTLLIPAALGLAARSPRRDQLIAKRPYNNRYNPASGARDEKSL